MIQRFFLFIILLIISSNIGAAIVVPVGLTAGDTYHVIFASSSTRTALSTDISDYDSFVQSAANSAGIGASIGVTWLAVGSTATVDASAHLASLFPDTASGPIYNQAGELIVSSLDNLWDRASHNNKIRYDENGSAVATSVWTGSEDSGLKDHNDGYLGSPTGSVVIGGPWTTSQWIRMTGRDSSTSRSVYGLSSEITVTPIPLPPSIVLLLSAVGIFAVSPVGRISKVPSAVFTIA